MFIMDFIKQENVLYIGLSVGINVVIYSINIINDMFIVYSFIFDVIGFVLFNINFYYLDFDFNSKYMGVSFYQKYFYFYLFFCKF